MIRKPSVGTSERVNTPLFFGLFCLFSYLGKTPQKPKAIYMCIYTCRILQSAYLRNELALPHRHKLWPA